MPEKMQLLKREGARLTLLESAICDIVRSAFSGGEAFALPEGLDPSEVYSELQVQAIAGLALLPGGLSDACKDKALVATWLNIDLRRRALFGHLLEVQDEALSVLDAAGIRAVILKGAAAGALYPDPALRSYGDIDLMVLPDDMTRARKVLLGVGYLGEDDEGLSDHHIGLERDGVHLELHWRPNGIPDNAIGLESLFQESFAHLETACVQGHEFPVFPPMVNGVVLLLHVRKHLASGGLGFRQIIDWMLFAKKYLAHEGWAEFSQTLGDEKIERTAKCLTRFCQLYLGLPKDGFEWCFDIDSAICSDLLEHVMLLGNFGMKVVAKTGATALTEIRDPVSLFKYLQRGGRSNWKAARRHAILRPFAWIYQAVRCARIILTREDIAGGVRSDMEEAARRRSLGYEMGLYDR